MSESILIIESKNKDSNAKDLLENYGYTVSTVDNGQKGLDFINNNSVDLILCDVELQEMKGWELCKTIKENEKFSTIPIIIYTNNENRDQLVQAIRSGAEDYLLKNSEDVYFISKIYAILRLAKLQKENLKLAQLKTMHAMIIAMNHEFNNAINIISANIQIIYEALTESKQHVELLGPVESISTASTRVSELVKKTRDMIENEEIYISDYTDGIEFLDLEHFKD